MLFFVFSTNFAFSADEGGSISTHITAGSGIYYSGYRVALGAELSNNQWFAQAGIGVLVSDGVYPEDLPIGFRIKAGNIILKNGRWSGTLGVNYLLTPIKSASTKSHLVHEGYLEQGLYWSWSKKVSSGLVLGYGFFGERVRQPNGDNTVYGTAANISIQCAYSF